jgi:hypothetical protein
MCSTNDDVPRFVSFFEEQIALGLLSPYPKFLKSKGAIAMLVDERAEAKEEKEKIKKKKGPSNDTADLEKMILAKRQGSF